MGWHGSGTISISDGELRRFTFHDVATGEGRTTSYHAYLSEAHGTATLQLAVALPDSRAVNFPLPLEATGGRGILSASPMMVLDTAGTVRDTLALLSMPLEAEITTGVADGGGFHVFHPVEQYDIWRFAPDGIACDDRRPQELDGAGPAESGVTSVDLEGDTLFHRRIAYDPRPVPGGYYTREIDGHLDIPVVVGGEFTHALREFLERVRSPHPVTRVTVDSDDTIWLAGVDDGGEREWLMLDPSGSSIGRFRLPTTSWVAYAAPSEVWVVEKDALDIPYVVRYVIAQ